MNLPYEPRTAQEIFNLVSAHLLKQNAQAIEQDGSYTNCRYRTSTGLKCAIGCLIPDDEYDPRIEGMGAAWPDHILEFHDVPERKQILLRSARLSPDSSALVESLQHLHDTYPPEEWAYELDRIRRRFELSGPPL